MRLASIDLEWFRGAAETVSLSLKGKSVVLYGANGAGKSSFVDAVEYVLCKGRIGHLAHEYSGKKQERGVINTHKPTLQPSRATMVFVDGTRTGIDIRTNGTFSTTGNGQDHIKGLDYRRVVLRQDEVAAFISSAKGEKYSALLPLLGLEALEFTAENLRRLVKQLSRASDLEAKQRELATKRQAASISFSSADDAQRQIADLHAKYRTGLPPEVNMVADCEKIQDAIRTRVVALTPDVQRHTFLKSLADVPLEPALDALQLVEGEVAASSVTLIKERLTLLRHAATLVASARGERVVCPACGSDLDRADMIAHLESEREQLATEQALLDRYDICIDTLVSQVAAAKPTVMTPLVASWWTDQVAGGAADVEWLRTLEPGAIRGTAGIHLRGPVRERLLPIVRAAQLATPTPPPGTEEILADSATVRAAEELIGAATLALEVEKITSTIAYVEAVEVRVRLLVREQSDTVIADISTDIQRMWGILHPENEIEDVRLRHPDETDKAIDIELKFFGVEQKSPRLTLSEGNRNSLGLCVFLSMARRADVEVPVILDDVVVSLDRDHRGMIVELLQKEFADRQVLLCTHDRDWFAELRQQLDSGWDFQVLRPYTSPDHGISWSNKSDSFADARAILDTAPDSAANIARKIMDTELGLLSEKLRIRVVHRLGSRNDHRGAHEFLADLIAAIPKAFQRKDANSSYAPEITAAPLLSTADKLLITWGNKGSHTFDVVKAEAAKLIDACERALTAFRCGSCGKLVYKADDGKAKQCECGHIRWRYERL